MDVWAATEMVTQSSQQAESQAPASQPVRMCQLYLHPRDLGPPAVAPETFNPMEEGAAAAGGPLSPAMVSLAPQSEALEQHLGLSLAWGSLQPLTPIPIDGNILMPSDLARSHGPRSPNWLGRRADSMAWEQTCLGPWLWVTEAYL